MQHIVNMKLRHPQFGEGALKSFEGNSITVRFSECEKKFAFPAAFDSGELRPTNEAGGERVKELKACWVAKLSGKAYTPQKETQISRLEEEYAARPKAEAASALANDKKGSGKKVLKRYSASEFNFGKASFAVGVILAVLFVCAFCCIIAIAHISR